jgi:hypothetical protein
MKTTKFLSFLFVLAISLGFVSCSDDDDDTNPKNPATVKLPVKYEAEDDTFGLYYTYDNNTNHVIKMVGKYDDGDEATTEITYYANGQISQIKTVEKDFESGEEYNEEYSFTYEGNKITATRKDSEQTDNVIELNDKGEVVSIKGWDGQYHEFKFTYDSKANITSVEDYYRDILSYKETYTYDDKNGWNKNVNLPEWAGYYAPMNMFVVSKVNNHLTIKEEGYSNGQVSNSGTTTITCKYDSEGYPVEMEQTREGKVTKIKITYEEKAVK